MGLGPECTSCNAFLWTWSLSVPLGWYEKTWLSIFSCLHKEKVMVDHIKEIIYTLTGWWWWWSVSVTCWIIILVLELEYGKNWDSRRKIMRKLEEWFIFLVSWKWWTCSFREKWLASMLLLAYGNLKENTCFEAYKKRNSYDVRVPRTNIIKNIPYIHCRWIKFE